jgi:indolepyruvate ferredoxin oxidoreductase
LPDPKTFAVINELVCEGCGDCSTESNCLSIEPKETEFGRKRQINQSNCNKDMSCLNGFCPSFVTVEGAERRKPKPADLDIGKLMQDVPLPALPTLDQPFNLLVTGVGGTGVVTVGQLISMAAHLEGKGASILDFTGFAQKFGAVLSFVRIGRDPDALNQVRIDTGMADAVIGCDVVVSSSPKASGTYQPGTSVALNLASMPTGDLVLRRDADLKIDARASAIASVVGADNMGAFDANSASEALFGDAVYANVMMLGFAWQRGLVPVTLDALTRAIELNNVAVDANKRALACGRLMAVRSLGPGCPSQSETGFRDLARGHHRAAGRVPGRLPEPGLGGSLSQTDGRVRGQHAGRKPARTGQRSGEVSVQADVLQGRIRSGAAA